MPTSPPWPALAIHASRERARAGARRSPIARPRRWTSLSGAACCLLLVAGAAGCHRDGGEKTATPRGGKWKAARNETAAQVAAIPYSRGYVPPTSAASGVVRYDRARAAPGLNLLASGHAAEAVLFAMDGREMRRWALPLAQAFPDLASDPEAAKLDYWRRVRLDADGSLLAIYEGLGIVKVDRASRLLWRRAGNFHHDLDVAADGSIWVLDREGKVLPRINPDAGVLEDFLTRLTPAGEVAERISILRAFEDSPFASFLDGMPRKGDILHTNTLEILDDARDGGLASALPAFRSGNILISVLQTSTLAVIDPQTRQVVWALRGPWRKQHQPTVLANGHLLLFDNTGLDRDHSRVLEIDPQPPQAGAILWQYGGTAGEPLASRTLGSVQRLANGNTLITEAERGRAVEVTPGKEIVWEYLSPFRTGEHDALVAALLEVTRIPPPPSS